MNIKTKEQQLADRAVSVIERLNLKGISDKVVNLTYKTNEFKNKRLKDDVEITLNKTNIECLLGVLEFYEDIADVAYGNKLYTSVRQYEREQEREKFRYEQMEREMEENRRTLYIHQGSTYADLADLLLHQDQGLVAKHVLKSYDQESEVTQESLDTMNYHYGDKQIIKFRK